MQTVRGVAVERVEHEGIAAPAFVLRYSKSSSQNAQVTFAAVALLSLFVLIKPESFPSLGPPAMARIEAAFTLAFSLWLVAVTTVGNRSGRSIVLLREGVLVRWGDRGKFASWDDIEWIGSWRWGNLWLNRSFGMRVRRERHRKTHEKQRHDIFARKTWVLADKGLIASPDLLHELLIHYWRHPEDREKIGTPQGLQVRT